MPLYEFVCPACLSTEEIFMHVSEYEIPSCPNCGRQMHRRYTPPVGIHTFTPYKHHGIGEYVTSKRDLKNKMQKKAEEVSARTGLDTSYELP